ncbi:MAG: hypothetical protein U0744_20395 [Gemmataceae bacterium]
MSKLALLDCRQTLGRTLWNFDRDPIPQRGLKRRMPEAAKEVNYRPARLPPIKKIENSLP